jgi:type I restriction enzyme S subunit
MKEQENIPIGWIAAPLKELSAYIQRGKSPKYAEVSELPVVNQKCVRWGGIDINHLKYIHPDQWEKWNEERFLQEGDILWNSTGTGTIGRACIYKNQPIKAVVDSHVTVLRLLHELAAPKYIFYFVMSPFIQKKIEAMQSGSTNQVELGKGIIENTSVPVPPLNEQNRIVDKIERLFSGLDEGEALLKQVQKQLATYRQSVLKAAVTGELTKNWREDNKYKLESSHDLLERILLKRRQNWKGKGKYEEPTPPDTSNLSQIPDEWIWIRLKQIGKAIGGLTKNSKRCNLVLKRPMLRVANVYQNYFKLSEIHQIGLSELEFKRVALENDDILIVEGNGSKNQIGRMAIWKGQIPNCTHQNHLIKFRLIEKGLPKYMVTWFMSLEGRNLIERVATSTSGLYTLNLRKIEDLIMPLPPLIEIEEIDNIVSDVFSRIDALSSWCENELKRSSNLRQSILKDAFSGKLVSQNPSDEPATELLSRYNAEKRPKSQAKVKKIRV